MKKILKFTLFLLFFFNNYVFAENHNEKINSNNELFIGQINASVYSKGFKKFSNYNIDFYLGSEIQYEDESSYISYKLIINFVFPALPFDYSNRKLIIPFSEWTFEREIQSYEENILGLNQLKFIVNKYKEWYQVVIDNKINDYLKLIGYEYYNNYPGSSIRLTSFYFSKQPDFPSNLVLNLLTYPPNENYFYDEESWWAEYYLNFNQVKQLENLLDKDFLLSKISELEKQENIDEMFN